MQKRFQIFVDANIVRTAIKAENIYMYKKKVPILPLIIQVDTLTISTCGVKTQNMNTMINTCANIMGLQFGSDKCVKLHIGKNHTLTYVAKERLMYGKKELTKTENGDEILIDKHDGKIEIKTVKEKK